MKKILVAQAVLALHMGLCAQTVGGDEARRPAPQPAAQVAQAPAPAPRYVPPPPMSDAEQQTLLRDLRARVESLEKRTVELERKLMPSREPATDGPARMRLAPR